MSEQECDERLARLFRQLERGILTKPEFDRAVLALAAEVADGRA